MDKTFDVFVPASTNNVGERGVLFGIAPGSGIVGRRALLRGHSEGLVLDYEGGIYQQSNIVTWADKVMHAAGRASTNYPTIARSWVKFEDVLHVGAYTLGADTVEVATLALKVLVCKWLGLDRLDQLDAELRRSNR